MVYCEDDNSIKIHNLENVKDKCHQYRFDFDFANAFDIDNKGKIVAALNKDNSIAIVEKYQKPIEDKHSGKTLYFFESIRFGKNVHKNGISTLSFTPNFDYLISCGKEDDTSINLFTYPKGEI